MPAKAKDRRHCQQLRIFQDITAVPHTKERIDGRGAVNRWIRENGRFPITVTQGEAIQCRLGLGEGGDCSRRWECPAGFCSKTLRRLPIVKSCNTAELGAREERLFLRRPRDVPVPDCTADRHGREVRRSSARYFSMIENRILHKTSRYGLSVPGCLNWSCFTVQYPCGSGRYQSGSSPPRHRRGPAPRLVWKPWPSPRAPDRR